MLEPWPKNLPDSFPDNENQSPDWPVVNNFLPEIPEVCITASSTSLMIPIKNNRFRQAPPSLQSGKLLCE